VEQVFMPVLNDCDISEIDKFRTVYEHVSHQIAKVVSGKGKMLVTGGGAFNTLLIELISKQVPVEVVIPSNEIISFKEALIFAFLGVLKYRGEINCLASVTGAKCDSMLGIMYFGSNNS
jgi:anhydro-N-acetylmuramic acid kinase